MKRVLKIVLIVFAAIVVIVLVVPLIVPIPPLEGTLPPENLADPDSRFVVVNNLKVHYKTAGQPSAGKPSFLLLHGFAASEFSWREVMQPLAQSGFVAAYDRPAFGLTQRPMPGEWTGINPYSPDAQVDLAIGMMDALGMRRTILVGNSAGGTVSVMTALRYPERVQTLILVDPAISGSNSAPWYAPLMTTPQMRRIGPFFTRNIKDWGIEFGKSAWHDPSKITPAIWAGYTKPLQAENWDAALWEFTTASRSIDLQSRLGELKLPVLVITGDDDHIVPTARTVQLTREKLPNAQLVVVPNCGHVPHEECPDAFMQAVNGFLAQLP